MFTLRLSALFAVLALSTAACAADTEEPDGKEEQAPTVQTSEVTPKYDPRITLADLRAAGAECVGTSCTFGGRSYDCSGGGNCAIVQHRGE
ncbi:MAG TPA: hypothetical protein VIF62_37620 [Labilithrix sp.]|jgi:hypothetical protein